MLFCLLLQSQCDYQTYYPLQLRLSLHFFQNLPPLLHLTPISFPLRSLFSDVFRCTHLQLDCAVSFETKTISGVATYDVERVSSAQSDEDKVFFDAKELIINGVKVNGKEVRRG